MRGSVTPRPLLPPGKTRYPLYRKLGGPQGRSGQVRKISPPTGIRSLDPPARSQLLYRLSYPRLIWEDNIKINFKDIAWEGVDWADLPRDRDTWLAVVVAVMKFRVP